MRSEGKWVVDIVSIEDPIHFRLLIISTKICVALNDICEDREHQRQVLKQEIDQPRSEARSGTISDSCNTCYEHSRNMMKI